MRWMIALAALCFAALATAIYLIVARVPNEWQQGVIFKIFFFHVPAAWAMLFSAIVSAGGAIAHLRGKPKGDMVAAVAGELAVVFGIMMMVTGPIWASRAWGKPWVWEPRLTTALVCWLTFVVYVFVRRFAGAESAPRISAALAIFGAANVPLVYFSVQLWGRTWHPPNSVVVNLEPIMQTTVRLSGLGFLLLWVVFFMLRYRQEKLRREIDALYARTD